LGMDFSSKGNVDPPVSGNIIITYACNLYIW
jgi:hypothetical protein